MEDDSSSAVLIEDLDRRSQSSCSARWSSGTPPLHQHHQGRSSRGVLNRSCSVPDSNNPPSTLAPHGDISVPVADLSEIGAGEEGEEEEGEGEEEEPGMRSGRAWSGRLRRPLDRGQSCEACYPVSWNYTADCVTDRWAATESSDNGVGECTCSGSGSDTAVAANGDDDEDAADESPGCGRRAECDADNDESEDGGSLGRSLYALNNHMTKSMLCLNEETQDEVCQLLVIMVIDHRSVHIASV